MRDIDNYFLLKNEPEGSCLLALRKYITAFDAHITEEWKYAMPFYYYKGKMLCYLRIDRKTGLPYIGFADGYKIDHPDLVAGVRTRMKILPVDPLADIPLDTIGAILADAVSLFK